MTDFRALLKELLEKYDMEWKARWRIKTVLALAQPEPQEPTQKEAVALYSEIMAVNNCQTLGEMAEHFARAILDRWGRPAIEPVPVSERPWERKGWCDADGQCWMGDAGGRGFVPSWRLCKPDDSCLAWSLPHWALPVPNSYSTTPGNQ
jgi:hypothetical protein